MSPEAIDYLGAAERALDRARRIAKAGVYDSAAREAYVAALGAARAVIFDKTGTAPKTHAGVRMQFFKLIHDGLPFDLALARFLQDGFDVKQTVDYDVVPAAVDRSKAQAFIVTGAAFIATAKTVLES